MLRTLLVVSLLVAAASALTFKAPEGGQNWALLMAGSNTWGNYRHQADIYHSYQILLKGGIPKENIIVMHYDDIANSASNPKKGTVINKPDGTDVYAGVPKDYVGKDVNAANFLKALLGKTDEVETVGTTTCDHKGRFVCAADLTCCCDKHGLFACEHYTCCNATSTCDPHHKQGCMPAPPPPASKKVIASGPNDNVFVYFADHGGPGILGVPSGAGDYIHAKDIVDTLKTKAANKGFKQLTFYLEACESGSIFDGLLPDDINVYVTTAANPSESSWGTYCPGMTPAPPSGYNTCLGDLYSVAWLENADASDLKTETLQKQYELVKTRTSHNGTYSQGSHVMQYGQTSIASEDCDVFEGTSSAELGATVLESQDSVKQRDAILIWMHHEYMTATEGPKKAEALRVYETELRFRAAVDSSVAQLAQALAGPKAESIMTEVHTPVVEDWDCFKGAIQAFQAECMPLKEYGMKHTRTLANLCDAGMTVQQIGEASRKSCSVVA